jgi:hypothetical protein
MITAIFNKSKPINLVLISLMLVFGFFLVQFQTIETFSVTAIFYKIGLVFLVILSALVVDFIVKKNALSGQNSFVVFFFTLFFFYFWSSNNDFRLILANLFILLALRKIISLKSQIATTKKIFDAALWICVASLFHFWSILFLLVLYLGIMLYVSNYYKNWLVPLVGGFVVFMIVSGYELVINDRFFNFSNAFISTDFSLLNSSYNWVIGGFFTIILIVSLIFLPSRIRLKLQKNKLSYLILIIALITGLVLFLISPNKSSAMLIFLYFPLASLFTSFFEKITKPIIQSVLLYSMFLISVILCFVSA